jgi:AcrR family transcriptional regulator
MAIKEEIETFRRERIRNEAERLFYERGFSRTSMDAIADSLQTAKPFIYGSYASKGDILFDIHLRVANLVMAAVEASLEEKGSPTENLRAFALRLTDIVLSNQAGIAVYFREEGNLAPKQLRKIADIKGKIDSGISRLITAGLVTGDFDVSDPRMAALAIVGMINWIYTWYRSDGRLDGPAIGERMATYALGIAGARRRKER